MSKDMHIRYVHTEFLTEFVLISCFVLFFFYLLSIYLLLTIFVNSILYYIIFNAINYNSSHLIIIGYDSLEGEIIIWN